MNSVILPVTFIFLLISVSFFAKLRMNKHRESSKAAAEYAFENGLKAGNDQLTGSKDNQNDCFAVIPYGGATLAVADGLGDKQSGRMAAEAAVRAFIANFQRGVQNEIGGAKRFFQESLRLSEKRVKDCSCDNTFGVMLAVVMIENDMMYYACKGACAVYI